MLSFFKRKAAAARLGFMDDHLKAGFDALPAKVRDAIAANAPDGKLIAWITPMVDDGGDATGKGWVKDKHDVVLLCVTFVPKADAWDGDDMVTLDVTLDPDTARDVAAVQGVMSMAHRVACRDSFWPAKVTVAA